MWKEITKERYEKLRAVASHVEGDSVMVQKDWQTVCTITHQEAAGFLVVTAHSGCYWEHDGPLTVSECEAYVAAHRPRQKKMGEKRPRRART